MENTSKLAQTASPRIKPSIWVAFGVFVAYVIVVNAIQLSSGLSYTEFFATAANAWRSPIASLAAGSAILLAFVLWSRWDGIWHDPAPLPMTRVMRIAPLVFIGITVCRLVIRLSAGVDAALLLALIVTGIGVGFAEELLFRGIVLRALRTNGRSEAWAMLWCSLWFGLMHITNVFSSEVPARVLLQVVLAGLTGATLYLFRRWSGGLLLPMLAHGVWDIATFLPEPEGPIISLFLLVLAPLTAIVSGVAVFRHDRQISVRPEGIVPLGE